MRPAFLVMIMLMSLTAAAQRVPYNSEACWAAFAIQDTIPQPEPGDTCVVFVSNRHFQRDSLRFLDEFVDTSRLRYFFLRRQGARWQVFETSSLSDAMEMFPDHRDIVVYTEGMGKIFTNNVERAGLMTEQYGVHVVMFDYASINSEYRPSRNFKFARANAALSSPQYFTLLKDFQSARDVHAEWMSGTKLTLFFHSMGNIVLRNMMRTQHFVDLNVRPFVNNVVLNAACVPQRQHVEWVEQIRFAGNVFIHYNRHDIQLKGAHLLTFQDQLGEVVHQHADNAHYINFHDYVGWKHSYFLNFPYSRFQLTDGMKVYFNQILKGNVATMKPASKKGNTLLTSRTLPQAAN